MDMESSMFHRSRLATVIIAAVLVATAGCANSATTPDGPHELRIGVESRGVGPATDPFVTDLRFLGTAPIYESLITWDTESNTYAPWLAESYTLSEDRTTLEMVLRDDVDFSDGTHLDAPAVAGYFDVARELAIESSYIRSAFFDAYGVEIAAPSEYELVFTTTKPMGDQFFDYLMYYVPLTTPEAARAAVDDPELLATEPIGTGPYLLDEWQPETPSISFVRNPDYWNPEAFDFDTVTIVGFADRIAAFNALQADQLNAVSIDPNMAEEAERLGLSIHTGAAGFVALFILDVAGNKVPALSDVRVREAMNLAFDREGIVEQIDLGLARVSSQAGNVGQAHYVEGGDDRYGYDLERARDLMEQAGYADGFDLVLPTAPGAGFFPSQYEAIVQQSLADIGIRVEYDRYTDLGAAATAMLEDKYAAALNHPDYRDVPSRMTEPGAFWIGPGKDPRYEELIDIADNGTIDESTAAFAEIGEYMLEESWFIVLSHPLGVWATDPEVELTLGTRDMTAQLRLFELAD
jgi:peptide/nickel transport system substrate-binding protein